MISSDLPSTGVAEEPEPTVEGALRRALDHGDLSDALLGRWAEQAGADPVPMLPPDILSRAAAFDPSVASAALSGREGFGLALVRADGALVWSDERFRLWIGDPRDSIGCRRLARQAAIDGKSISLVQTNLSVLTVLATAGAGLNRWRPFLDQEMSAPAATGAVLLVAFAPSRSSLVVATATGTFGLTAAEARLLEAVLEAPNLESAARNVGVSRETAKDTIARAAKRAGVRTSAELTGLVMDLSCGASEAPVVDLAAIQTAWALSPNEARVAMALTSGDTAKAVATRLGLSAQTVTTYRRTIFGKMGVNRSRDLRRLLSELAELHRLTGASEVVAEAAVAREQLRLTIDRSGRRIAFIDYGPVGGRLTVLGHGYSTGRLAPPPLLASLRRAGRRVIVIQRPGYGLTSPSNDGSYLQTAVDDVDLIAEAVKGGTYDVIARDGCAWALTLAQRHPDRLGRVLLLNPRQPKRQATAHTGRLSVFTRLLAHHPGSIVPFAEMLRRQSRSELVARVLRSVSENAAADRACIANPAVLDFLVRDGQGLLARSIKGFVAEQHIYADGWEVPERLNGPKWIIAYGAGLFPDPKLDIWRRLPDLEVCAVPDAGWLLQFTHPDLIAALLA